MSNTDTRFAIFEGKNPEDVERQINKWLSDYGYIVEGHSSFTRKDLYNNHYNIVIVIQYRME